jgi:hypothetical protein
MVLVACGSVLAACGVDSSAGPPKAKELVYCDNPDVAAPSCDLMGYDMVDDSALRAKLEGCAAGTCHGDTENASTVWTLDLSGSVQDALAPLATILGVNGLYYLVDDVDQDCSKMLTEVSVVPAGGLRMPLAAPAWSDDEIDCFRKYLHDMN